MSKGDVREGEASAITVWFYPKLPKDLLFAELGDTEKKIMRQLEIDFLLSIFFSATFVFLSLR